MRFYSEQLGDTAHILTFYPPYVVPHEDPTDPPSRELRAEALEWIRRADPRALRQQLLQPDVGWRSNPTLCALVGASYLYEWVLEGVDLLEEAQAHTAAAIALWEEKRRGASGGARRALEGLLAGARVNQALIDRLRGDLRSAGRNLDRARELDPTMTSVWVARFCHASLAEDEEGLLGVFEDMCRRYPAWKQDAGLHAALRVDQDLCFLRRHRLAEVLDGREPAEVVELSQKVAL